MITSVNDSLIHVHSISGSGVNNDKSNRNNDDHNHIIIDNEDDDTSKVETHE